MSDASLRSGTLVLVVGPSGAGKDTVISGARTALMDDPQFVFPRRVVTRPSSTNEDHDSLSDQAFDCAITNGAFALHWEAHGLKYGIPRTIDDDLAGGRTVVCNVSRTVVASARARYTSVALVLVTAPVDVLESRLRARRREAKGDVASRLKRNDRFAEIVSDHLIDNVGDPAQAIAAFIDIAQNLSRETKQI